MVATDQHYASQVGADVLARGGNAIDAAVAVGYALAVVDPCCGNIGGGGFMLIRFANGQETFIDFREKAPLRATRDLYLDALGNIRSGASTEGYLAAGVPGSVAGLEFARTRYGTMSRPELMAPAITLARKGFVLGPDDAGIIAGERDRLAADPAASHQFLRGGTAPSAGSRLIQPDLASTLSLIARDGPDEFYRGPLAAAVVAASRAHGGILSLRDFSSYSVVEAQPIHCRYRGYDIYSAPPPSSGGVTMCETLGILEPYPLSSYGFGSVAALHLTVEAERRAFADRNIFLGDPAFVNNPVSRLLSADYLSTWRETISGNATPSKSLRPGAGILHEGTDTTHYSIVDRFGNAVSVTYTINDTMGAAVIAPHTGFLLNDEMDDFTSKVGVPNIYGLVQGSRNAIAPGKRPLSSMAPTIVTKDGRLFMVVGSPGGPRIITAVMGAIQNVIDYHLSPADAVAAPRVHEQWLPDVVFAEHGAISKSAAARLREMGYTLAPNGEWSVVEMIEADPRTGVLTGVADPRRPSGAAIGPSH